MPWPTAEPAHAQQNEQALLPSLNRSLDEDSFHTLTVIASVIERILPDVVAVTFKAVNSISGLPSANEFTRTPVGEVIVTFNKAINPATFDHHDLTMMHEGATVDLSGIQISDPLDNSNESSTFKFDLSSLTTLDGYYSLAVQTAEIDDAQGYHGETGKTCGWIQLTDGQCNLTVKVSPEGAGTVTPGTAKHDYYSNVDMTAKANEGYYFVGWKHAGTMLSTDNELTVTVTQADSYEAVFGVLAFVEAQLSELSADNVSVFSNPRGEYYRVTMDRKLTKGQWNTFCAPFDISEQQINKTWGYNTSLAVLKSVDADGTMNFEYAWNIKAGVAYLIKPECTVENPVLEYKGNLKLAPEPIPTDIDGYNYIGIYSPRTWTGVDEWYFGVKTSQLIKVKQSLVGQNLNGFRAFFLLPSGQSARLSIYGVITTGIDELESPIATHPASSRVYNLQGVYMGDDLNRLPAGMYIVNGKKTVKR